MNYYERHIGDFIRDTVSLTMVEDGAYNRLMDQCYQTERPLPATKALVYRLARATTPAEKKAVDFVLDSFFVLGEDGYRQKRIDAEIARYQDKQRKAKASADARWGNRGAHANADANASRSDHATDMRTHSEGNAHQAPSTKHQTPNPKPTPAATEPVPRPVAIAVLLRPLGLTTNASNPIVRAWAEAGHTDETLLLALSIAKKRRADAGDSNPVNPGYLDAILNDPAAMSGGTREAKVVDRWWTSNEGIDRKGRELRMLARGGEDYSSFAERIRQRLSEETSHA